MPKNFNGVDWVALDIPEMPHWLEGMISYDKEIREAAYNGFYDSGVIELNKATPYVIPFLIEFLTGEDTPRKDVLLQLLIVLASEANAYLDHSKLAELAKTTLAEIAKGIWVFESYQQMDDTKELALQLAKYIK